MDSPHLHHKQPVGEPLHVKLPDDSTIKSTHTAELQIPGLPKSAKRVHLFPSLGNTSLLSIGQLCDSGCKATFTADKVIITHRNNTILSGTRSPLTNGLWTITMPHSLSIMDSINTITMPTKAADMVTFSHASLFSPSISTLSKALEKDYVSNFPGLTLASLKKYPPQSVATHKGHLDQSRANQRSTNKHKRPPRQKQPSLLTPQEEEDSFPLPIQQGTQTHNIYPSVLEIPSGKIHTDQTGKFPVQSKSGNNYLLVLYAYDANYIHAEPLKNRLAGSILEAYQRAHATLVKAGLRPKLQRLDNECSEILKEYLHEQNVDFQLVPPGCHRRNAAERAIRTWKNHFIAGLSSCDPKFPLNLWDHLVEQANITLNLLRGSRMNPKLSAYTQVHGIFNFNKTPLAPPGTRILIHEKSDKRATWAPHGVDGWYIGPAMEHYRCYTTWVTHTNSKRITDTVAWFPHWVKMPTSTPLEILASTAQDLLAQLKNPPKDSPFPPFTDSQTEALRTLSEIYQPTGVHPIEDPEPPPAPPLQETAPALRVDNPPVEEHQPPLRVENLPPAPPEPEEEPQPALRVEDTNNTDPTQLDDAPNFITQEDEDPEPEDLPAGLEPDPEPEDLPEDYCQFESIINHQKAPRGCGASQLIEVKWRGYEETTWERPHIFTDHYTSEPATSELVKYAQQNNLLDTPGFKNLRRLQTNQANSASHHSPLPIGQDLTNNQRKFFHQCLSAVHPDTGRSVEYPALLKSSDGKHWEESNCEEIGRLAQGYHPKIPQGTNTLHFIRFSQVPKDRKVTYLRIVVADRPQKSNPRRVRWTVGGDKLDYIGDLSTKTSDMVTAKIMFNSVLSTPDAFFMGLDIKDFYLNTAMDRYEYMKIPVKAIPTKIMDLYNLWPLVINGFVYTEIQKSMYGLSSAGRIANDALIPVLAKAGYHQSDRIPGLFKHDTRPVAFALVVDDFGVKYVGKENAYHLINTLTNADYKITEDWEGNLFCGLTLKWDYENRTLDLSMPGYVSKALQKFMHPPPSKPTNAPHKWTKPNYGAKTQMAPDADTSAPLTPDGIKRLQQVVGTFLYYARGVDLSLLVALGSLASRQTKGTEETMDACCHLLNYVATHPDATIRYHKSDMVLIIHSDASYLSESEARSRAGGFFFLGNHDEVENPPVKPNGAIHVHSTIMSQVLSSATEAELGALFYTAQDACHLRNTLEFLGHKQPATPIQTDNACAEGIINDTVKPKRSKSFDMKFFWIKDRSKAGQFKVFWRPGSVNLGDYFTKHHSDTHHVAMRPVYFYEEKNEHSINHCEGVLISIDQPFTNDYALLLVRV